MASRRRKNLFGSTRGLPCFYGNWCGMGCSGPGAPIDDVDRCCQKHDFCYERHGYFSCKCDQRFLKCLENQRDRSTAKGRKAAKMYSFYKKSWCR
ncbi:phospholipase A2 family protein [Brevibacillus panacihumi]|uniref:Phospholipase n=1 Tax=Brevibacillus panacihumi TaxID=497735 RepID=A0A3M8BXG6_9BACL|nr:phospholipase A2 family protein [Brevibacillus panacihumi]RNB68120.1 phospholipase [Brevibacillus panacihumi]